MADPTALTFTCPRCEAMFYVAINEPGVLRGDLVQVTQMILGNNILRVVPIEEARKSFKTCTCLGELQYKKEMLQDPTPKKEGK
jgi:hypothetical protein